MRSLKIPVFLQPFDKPYCGPTCIKMVLDFYRIKISLKTLVKQLPMTKTGIDLSSVGLFLRNFGFIALFVDKEYKGGRWVWYKSAVPLFTKQGIYLIHKEIRISDMREVIAMGCPIIINIESSKNPGGRHFVVVKNIGKKRATINDPNCGQKIMSIKKLISSCHNCGGGAIVLVPDFIIKNHFAN